MSRRNRGVVVFIPRVARDGIATRFHFERVDHDTRGYECIPAEFGVLAPAEADNWGVKKESGCRRFHPKGYQGEHTV